MCDAGDGGLVGPHGQTIVAVDLTKPSREIIPDDKANDELIEHLEHACFFECLVSLTSVIA
jgi:hypothetical protein